MTPQRTALLTRIAWAALAVPALLQIYLLLSCVLQRYGFPYDLEWMEGGMLNHAARISEGAGIYQAPSVDFIPFLYTPLYPGLLAGLEPLTGISYQVARAISILSILGIFAVIHRAIVGQLTPTAATSPAGAVRTEGQINHTRAASWVGAACACGLFAAVYPWVDGWYDIARADTLFLAMIIGGLLATSRWARTGTGWRGQARVGAAAAILALSFFCKQTGILYVAAGGAIVLVMNWRRVPVYVATAGAIGLGGTQLLTSATGGWFWTYIYEVHQAHDFGMHRFKESWGLMLGKFPIMTGVIAFGLVVVGATWAITRKRPANSTPLLVWTWAFAVSCLVGALGWGTQWAHYNAFLPAMLTGAIASGAAVRALVACLSAAPLPRIPRATGPVVGALTCGLLGLQLVTAWWQPAKFIPEAKDRLAGDRLIQQLAQLDGEVLIPFHPWYARLAGKRAYVHRMGVMDVSYRHPKKHQSWPVLGLREAFSETRFDYIIWDNRAIDPYFVGLERNYRLDDYLPADARPRVVTGNRVVPKQIWVPAEPLVPPPGVRVLWNFEDAKLGGFAAQGTAWGPRPQRRSLPKQGKVRRYGGRYYLTSMHGGDKATGVLSSPPFVLTGSQLTVRVGGGNDPDRLRAELHIGSEVVHSSTGENSERLADRTWDITAHQGKTARIVLVDESTGSWGHLNIDEIWMWP